MIDNDDRAVLQAFLLIKNYNILKFKNKEQHFMLLHYVTT